MGSTAQNNYFPNVNKVEPKNTLKVPTVKTKEKKKEKKKKKKEEEEEEKQIPIYKLVRKN